MCKRLPQKVLDRLEFVEHRPENNPLHERIVHLLYELDSCYRELDASQGDVSDDCPGALWLLARLRDSLEGEMLHFGRQLQEINVDTAACLGHEVKAAPPPVMALIDRDLFEAAERLRPGAPGSMISELVRPVVEKAAAESARSPRVRVKRKAVAAV